MEENKSQRSPTGTNIFDTVGTPNYQCQTNLLPCHISFRNSRPTAINTMQISENSFIKKLKSSGRSLVVFYGSQTGTAEEFAGRLAKEGIRYQLKGMVADPEECDMVNE